MIFTTGSVVKIVQTAKDNSDRLTFHGEVHLGTSNPLTEPTYSLRASHNITLQEIIGFGGAFTDSAAFTFAQLPEDKQEELLQAYFGEKGHKYSICRLTIGSSDFSIEHYNYANISDDWELINFSIDHDKAYIIPMIKRAQRIAVSHGTELKFIASPWSPPEWLKRNKRMVNSFMPGLRQDDGVFETWARYLSLYLSAYKEEGIHIDHITIQNEPHVSKQFAVTYECCGYEAVHERDFLRDFLGPIMAVEHPSIKIWIHDDQKNDAMLDMVGTIMDDQIAAKYVSGVAFHWYDNWGLNYDVLDQVHKMFPHLPLLNTEATNPRPSSENIGDRLWEYGQKYATDMLRDFNHHTTGFIDWNLVLDVLGGPSNQHLGDVLVDLGNCDSPIRTNFTSVPYTTVDNPKGTYDLIYQPSYYHIGHFTRFVPPGAKSVRIEQSPPPSEPTPKEGLSTSLESTAFYLREDERLVVVVTNFVSHETSYKLEVPGFGSATIDIPADAIQTLVVDLVENSEK